MRTAILEDGSFVRFADVDEVGVVLLDGPNVFVGYVDDAHNQGIWVDVDGARWFNTGDTARQDADGYFWLTGRKKELIIRGGHNIDPRIIEDALQQHPDVALAAAIGRPDWHAGEVPVAYVQLRPGATVSESDLATFASSRVGERAARPKAVHIVDELPMTTVGKIFKPALTMREIEDVVRGVALDCDTELDSVVVVQHPSRGLLTTVEANGDLDAFAQRLGQFTFAVELRGRSVDSFSREETPREQG
ncbi:AMP-binding protein [Microbacterium fluvii]|nr:AMP-binding protein [Microbacterium fluvii]